MSGPDRDWNLWRTFAAVMEQGSLSAAARRLGLTQPTAGRHIEALEAHLRYPLFVRTGQGLQPNPAAHDLMPLVSTLAKTANALERLAGSLGDAQSGVVRVTSSDVMSQHVLPAMLGRFVRDHPAIDIELSSSNAVEDLLNREADIAVRMAAPVQQALVARKVGRVQILLYAHKSYLDRHPMPRSVDDLKQHVLIGYDQHLVVLDRLVADGLPISRRDFAIRTDSEPAQLALLQAGAGIGATQDRLARADPELIPILPDLMLFPMDLWVVMHEDLRQVRPVRQMFDHLVDELGRYVAD